MQCPDCEKTIWRGSARCRECADNYRTRNPEDRFWKHVRKTEGCWEWTLTLRRGYGSFKHRGATYAAHRYSWELANGPVPPGELVLHECDNPKCVRPSHLFLGTHADNTADMLAKDRGPSGKRSGRHTKPECTARGERHGSAKLQAEQVLEIRRRAASGEGLASLAREFKITDVAVGAIHHRRTWTHL